MHLSEKKRHISFVQIRSSDQLTQVDLGGNVLVPLGNVAALALIFGVPSHDTVDAGTLIVAAVLLLDIGPT